MNKAPVTGSTAKKYLCVGLLLQKRIKKKKDLVDSNYCHVFEECNWTVVECGKNLLFHHRKDLTCV